MRRPTVVHSEFAPCATVPRHRAQQHACWHHALVCFGLCNKPATLQPQAAPKEDAPKEKEATSVSSSEILIDDDDELSIISPAGGDKRPRTDSDGAASKEPEPEAADGAPAKRARIA